MTTYALTIALLLLAAAPARAQDAPPADARWGPWLGCWRLVQDDRGSLTAAATQPEDLTVCVLPSSGDHGVGLTTYVSGRPVVQQTIVADGASRPVTEPECSGSQQSEWSLTGLRLFTRAEVVCGGQPARTVSGIALMTEGPTWVDIQAVGTDQDAQVRVRRYQRTSRPPEGVVMPAHLERLVVPRPAQFAAVTSMTLDEVVDASGKVAAPAVEAALVESGSRFDLNSRVLRDLNAADVPDGVVDVMLALSFPGRVALDRPLPGVPARTGGTTAASVRRSDRLPSYSYSPYDAPSSYYPYYPYYAYDPYVAYGSYYPYYFYASPFGYSNWWGTPYRYRPYSFRGTRPVVVGPGGPARPSGNGRSRVIQGRGYTQGRADGVQNAPRTRGGAAADGGRDRGAASGTSSGASSRRAVSRDGYSSGRSSSGAGSRSSGRSTSGGGTRSSGSGSSSGGSGSGSGRTAQPR